MLPCLKEQYKWHLWVGEEWVFPYTFFLLLCLTDCFVGLTTQQPYANGSSLPSLDFEQLHSASYLKSDCNCASIRRYHCHSEKNKLQITNGRTIFFKHQLWVGDRDFTIIEKCILYICDIWGTENVLNIVICETPPFRLTTKSLLWIKNWGWSAWVTSPKSGHY